MNLVDHVESCIKSCDEHLTKLDHKALNMQGMSAFKNRNFLNKVNELSGAKYLEIGVWKGSTFYSALYKNRDTLKYAVAIDNFCSWGGPRDEFHANISDVGVNYEFYDEDCFSFDKTKFKEKFNVYFFDGGHNEDDHVRALTYFVDSMEDDFIYVCDDWNDSMVQTGTILGIQQTNIQIVKQWILPGYGGSDTKNWWNGIYIAVCKKSK